MGCESLQKKFTRKSKPHVRPSPIVTFQDYTRAMTPMDRYRKHYAIFDYWNAQLLDVLQGTTMNTKRAQHASREAVNELKILDSLLLEGANTELARWIEERIQIDQNLQRGAYSPAKLWTVRQQLESQTRRIHRTLYWRNVEDHLRQEVPRDASTD